MVSPFDSFSACVAVSFHYVRQLTSIHRVYHSLYEILKPISYQGQPGEETSEPEVTCAFQKAIVQFHDSMRAVLAELTLQALAV
jgi:DNA-binding IscR family transcriptional regulator